MRTIVLFTLLTVSFAYTAVPSSTDRNCGSLYGVFLDAETGQGVGGIQVLLNEIKRSGVTHEDGHFFLPAIPMGTYTVQTFRIGYKNIVKNIAINRCDTIRVEFHIFKAPIMLNAVMVDAEEENTLDFVMDKNPVELEGKRLRPPIGTDNC